MAGRKSMMTADPAIADDASVTPRRDYINPDLLPAVVVLAALRIYLLFMMAVVVYQIWTGVH